ncbi:hypothetical protein [Pseudoalteromonas sp. G4]|uniref:hypothetical protein n=1 Tax=Pseudoalteromonas sp. G4 TaxID=2992761 RepID=UPI00237DAA7B|nr:hypothetical protein [Pseudoalteromonas sp. G4]MDE3271987.1 hypothetical protein [Pseudoalteromonas sp. G4]
MIEQTLKSIPNLALFQRVTCQVLNQLKLAFPNPSDISCTQLAQQIINETALENTLVLDIAIEISAVISWLEKAGLIWVGGHDLNDFFDVTISKQGLSKLLIEMDGESLAQKLSNSPSKEAQFEIIESLISNH